MPGVISFFNIYHFILDKAIETWFSALKKFKISSVQLLGLLFCICLYTPVGAQPPFEHPLSLHILYYFVVELPFLFEIELEETVGDLGAALTTEDKHGLASNGYGEVAASRRTVPRLSDLFPLPSIPLGTGNNSHY